jgi:hypothetical protein
VFWEGVLAFGSGCCQVPLLCREPGVAHLVILARRRIGCMVQSCLNVLVWFGLASLRHFSTSKAISARNTVKLCLLYINTNYFISCTNKLNK